MKRVVIIGGETHIAEITGLNGTALEVVGASVRDDQLEWAKEQFGCPVVTDSAKLLADYKPDVAAVANENDFRADTIFACIDAGCDVIADKPIAITASEQNSVEKALAEAPERRLLNLLTLRGVPHWRGVRDIVESGRIGEPAFVHIRMAVRLKREHRPLWFLDVRRSGGLFLDLLIHGIDQVEWITGERIVAMTANTGNLQDPSDTYLRDHAAVYCELSNGAAALVEGQRTLPDTKGSDYRVHVAGTKGYLDLDHAAKRITVTDSETADAEYADLPEPVSVVEQWLEGGDLVSQADSLRANRLAVLATKSAAEHKRVVVD